MPRRSTSSLWPHPEQWGDRARKFPWRRCLLNWHLDQQMFIPKSAGIIGGRRIVRQQGRPWRIYRGTPTVSVALMRQRIHYLNNKHRMMQWN